MILVPRVVIHLADGAPRGPPLGLAAGLPPGYDTAVGHGQAQHGGCWTSPVTPVALHPVHNPRRP